MEVTNWFQLIVMLVSSNTATASDCGQITNTSISSGAITIPLDTINKTCQWNIELPPQYTSLQIRFHDLKLRNCTNCSCDYVEVWNASTKSPERWVGKYCGDLKDKDIHTKGNTVLVEFGSSVLSGMISNATLLSYRGWKAPFTTLPSTDCGKITNTSYDYGTITSPVNTANKTCLWHIQVSPTKTEVGLSFRDLKLRADCPNCSCDYIEVWNSSTKDPKHWIGKYCGNLKYKYIRAQGSNVLVEFGSSVWSRMKRNYTFLSYQGYEIIICIFPTDHFGIHTGKAEKPDSTIGSGSSILAVTAIGIVFSVFLFVGALACGIYAHRHMRRNHRVRGRRRPSQLQQQPVDLPHLPKLPNYFDTDDHVVLPPYLGFTPGEWNKAVDDSESPPPYDHPPPYSITEAAETAGVETTVQEMTAETNS